MSDSELCIEELDYELDEEELLRSDDEGEVVIANTETSMTVDVDQFVAKRLSPPIAKTTVNSQATSPLKCSGSSVFWQSQESDETCKSSKAYETDCLSSKIPIANDYQSVHNYHSKQTVPPNLETSTSPLSLTSLSAGTLWAKSVFTPSPIQPLGYNIMQLKHQSEETVPVRSNSHATNLRGTFAENAPSSMEQEGNRVFGSAVQSSVSTTHSTGRHNYMKRKSQFGTGNASYQQSNGPKTSSNELFLMPTLNERQNLDRQQFHTKIASSTYKNPVYCPINVVPSMYNDSPVEPSIPTASRTTPFIIEALSNGAKTMRKVLINPKFKGRKVSQSLNTRRVDEDDLRNIILNRKSSACKKGTSQMNIEDKKSTQVQPEDAEMEMYLQKIENQKLLRAQINQEKERRRQQELLVREGVKGP